MIWSNIKKNKKRLWYKDIGRGSVESILWDFMSMSFK